MNLKLFQSSDNKLFKDVISELTDSDFTRTTVDHGTNNEENLIERSSWTCNKTFKFINNNKMYNEIGSTNEFKLIRYKAGDFFVLHTDSQKTHTCLIMCGPEHQGGVLTLKKNDFVEIKINSDKIIENNGYYMVLFSIIFYTKYHLLLKVLDIF